jgi:hypothetical protein
MAKSTRPPTIASIEMLWGGGGGGSTFQCQILFYFPFFFGFISKKKEIKLKNWDPK